MDVHDNIITAIEKFVDWLDQFGETSYDHQTFFAGPVGGKAKALYYNNPWIGIVAVSPMIFSEAFFPAGRQLFWKKQRFPIADAHYAMGFALLSRITKEERYYKRAVHFIEELMKSRSPGFQNYCWGYPFDWVTKGGTIPAHTPFVTTLPYVYEAFEYVYRLDKKETWLEIMHSIAEHAIQDIEDFELSPGVYSCGYGPYDNNGGVVNASAYRAFLLSSASIQFSDERYWKAAEGNINFVLAAQQPDGSWPYAVGGERAFIDHFHTCFVLKALAKIQKIKDHDGCRKAIEKGVAYYLEHLLDESGLPKPFSKAPRLTVYHRELYDYAECINLCLLLRDSTSALQKTLNTVTTDILNRWIKKGGSFRSRELILGWDNVPMHRWAQSQMFRSLAFYLHQNTDRSGLKISSKLNTKKIKI
jgi:hypothetical protein